MKTLFPSFQRSGNQLVKPGWLLLPVTLLLGYGQSAQAQSSFPRFEAFTTNSAANFTLGGKPNRATLTGTTNSPGFLRLTNDAADQSGYVIDQLSFPAPQGFSVSFEFFSYGGSGADGFSMFLIDADKTTAATFTPGASGGSLGYAQKTAAPASSGVPNGYIGIGIDEFGNFANPTEGRSGGPGAQPDAISVRGAGNGSTTADYPFLAGSGTLPFSLDVGTAGRVTNLSDPNYRRAYIDVIPQGTAPNITYRITVRIQHGNAVTKAIDNLSVPTPPANLRIGFAGSTGTSTNIHEIRNLSVVQSPVANDDVVSTIYNQNATFNVISNDQFFGSNFKPGAVDLDITTAGVQSTYNVPGKGSFSVDVNGLVTFTPSGTFAGVVTLPYVMQDLAGSTNTRQYYSNPANIIVNVEGADVVTNISGPTSVDPGSQLTYTVSTSNIGTQVAMGVVPTLQLPASLSNVTVSSGSYDASSGMVTFATVASIAVGAAPIINTVSFTAPTTGSTVVGTATYVTPPTIPDPVTTNDVAVITTVIAVPNAAGVCATPGKDGPRTLTSTTVPNTYYPGSASATKGNKTISLGQSTGSTTAINAGDLLLVMQMQGAEINTSNTNSYGSGTTNTGSGNTGTNYTAGLYEYVTAANSVPVGGGSLQLITGLSRDYTNADFSATGTGGQQRFQVIRVPQYSSLTVTGTVTGTAWNGSTGGVMALDVAGRTTFATDGTSVLTMTGKGFRGGGAFSYGGNSAYTINDYANLAPTNNDGAHGTKGEGIVGTPRYINSNGAILSTSVEGYNGGSVGRGAPGNGGGGGVDANPGNNDQNTGGGGGSNGGAGGNGGAYNFNRTGQSLSGGIGGAKVEAASASRLAMGGGGGAGGTNANTTNAPLSNGGNGGGIIIFRSGSVSNTGTVQANGGGGSAAVNSTAAGSIASNGGGGGGAGGTVLVAVQNDGIGNVTLQTNGGAGGRTTSGSTSTQFGGGGGGGGGSIYANGSINNASSKASGTFGTSAVRNGTATANGATAGSASIASNMAPIPAELASVGSCMPILTVSLETSTANVTRASNSNVNPALYTLTVSNTGGMATDVTASATLPASIFTYDMSYASTGTLTLADGTTSSLNFTKPTAANNTPSFTGFSIPAGATVRFNFRATIDKAGEDNVKYQADGTVSYMDPTRTTTNATIQPRQTYAGGGTVNGSNYLSASSTAEDVMIARPLPVELKRFDVAAVHINTELNWATASELQNDHFEIERSLDGREFERIGSVKGQGTTSRETAYQYSDINAARLSLKPMYYRLRQVDRDGSTSYSPVRTVRFVRDAKVAIALYPNPHTGSATLDLTALTTMEYSVEVLDLAGRRVTQFELKGGLQHPLDLHSLPLGSYIIRVQSAETVITLPMIRN